MLRVLVVGAGGLGCEVMKNLALSSLYYHLEIVDFDAIELANLNRQFMYTEYDIGAFKALTSAKWLMAKFPRLSDYITSRCVRIECLPIEFFASFNIIYSCLDSLAARRWLNMTLVDLATEGITIPLIDGGTEGYFGHVALVIPGVTACIDCLSPIFKTETRPICTLTGIVDSLEDCIRWAAFKCHEDDNFNLNDEEYGKEIIKFAREKAAESGLDSAAISMEFVSSVLKGIVPSISTTNSIIGGVMTKIGKKLHNGDPVTLESPNFYNYCGENGVRLGALTINYQDECPTCGKLWSRSD